MSVILGQHDGDTIVAFGSAGERSARDLLDDCSLLAGMLPEPHPASQVLLVFRHDRYAFTVALLAAWQRGHRVALPANTQRDSIWHVADRPETVQILHDTESGEGLVVAAALERAGRQASAAAAPAACFRLGQQLEVADATLLSVFTSGTSGQPRAFEKTAAQLWGEAQVLRDTFDLVGARVVGTVPPGHIYGLLFTVLVPLVSGGAFLRETLLHAEPIAARVADHAADVVVTVPAHLRGFGVLAAGALAGVRRVFSSTAALGERTAREFQRRQSTSVTEVFGSTETGGIAWRQRDLLGEDCEALARWRPLTGVELSVDADGHLLVRSPFVDRSGDSAAPYKTQDLVELCDDQCFVHQGRADGVVKLGGRRVSLPAMEAALRAIDGVDDVALLAVDSPTGRGKQILAAVACTDDGAARAPQGDSERLRAALSTTFDRSTIPRRFVFVDRLPRETNGKLQHAALSRLFGLTTDGLPLCWELEWGEAEQGRVATAEDERLYRVPLRVPERYGWFEGHFPGYPILAAAVQLREIILPRARQARGELGALKKMSQLKFLKRIAPGDALVLELRWAAAPAGDGTVSFALKRGDAVCSSGRLAFGEGS